ncbi:MAG: DUF4426 domain-containing protein [Enterobacterales bacterium]|nr:DUF4426 domain-containing protein [Enterobacterales bacterium]
MVSVQLKKITLAFILFFASFSLFAEEHTVGEFTVHYNLLNSSLIEPEIATQYGIKRSKNIALLNVSIIQKSDKPEGTAVIANIFGHGASLAGQVKELAFKEVKEGTAIYYLATFPINNGERLSFDLQIQPNKQGKLIPLKFKRKVYVD